MDLKGLFMSPASPQITGDRSLYGSLFAEAQAAQMSDMRSKRFFVDQKFYLKPAQRLLPNPRL